MCKQLFTFDKNNKNKKKVFILLLCDDYVSIITDGTSVSTFLCTRKLGPEEVNVTVIAV